MSGTRDIGELANGFVAGRISRRDFLEGSALIGMGGLAALVVAACGTQTASPASSSAAGSSAQASASASAPSAPASAPASAAAGSAAASSGATPAPKTGGSITI